MMKSFDFSNLSKESELIGFAFLLWIGLWTPEITMGGGRVELQGMTKKFSQSDKKINNYKTIKLTKNVTENCYASYN